MNGCGGRKEKRLYTCIHVYVWGIAFHMINVYMHVSDVCAVYMCVCVGPSTC